jgi:GT2 family glycosyltransferase
VPSIAVLITVHNRRQITLTGLSCLFAQELPPGYSMEVILVDDGSTDGTSEAIRQQFPQVRLLQGSGQLYWGGGMRMAFGTALQQGFDYYLWLNDDAFLYSGALQRLLACSEQLGPEAVVVGATWDPQSGQMLTSGCVVARKRFFRVLKPQLPGEQPIKVATMAGNCVLIPDKVARSVGNIDAAFPHGLGDLDYGWRVTKGGFSVWVCPGFVADCSRPTVWGQFDPKAPLLTRLKQRASLKGYPPVPSLIYCRRHYGLFWLLYWIKPYWRVFFRAGPWGKVQSRQ